MKILEYDNITGNWKNVNDFIVKVDELKLCFFVTKSQYYLFLKEIANLFHGGVTKQLKIYTSLNFTYLILFWDRHGQQGWFFSPTMQVFYNSKFIIIVLLLQVANVQSVSCIVFVPGLNFWLPTNVLFITYKYTERWRFYFTFLICRHLHGIKKLWTLYQHRCAVAQPTATVTF